jgi:NDP-sugar pyrophosphorylase family protein
MKAVILAGGKGTRLLPYTTVLPKPLLPVGEKPILDTVVRQLKTYGFSEITMAVGYLAELITAYFGDGSRFGVKIRYSREDEPLGTAGPLRKIPGLKETFLVMNGDILTTLDYGKLLAYHKKSGAVATIAMRKRDVKVDFGVIEADKEDRLTDYLEKPTLSYLVSMGVYVFEPEVLEHIKEGERLDFPDLVRRLIKKKKKVVGYRTDEYWLDIGRHDDYDKAREDFEKVRNRLNRRSN